METTQKFSKESTINVKVPSDMTLEQTHTVTEGVLRILGCPTCYSGFKILFGAEADLITATVNGEHEVTVDAVK
jgi:hypothetical protein